MNISPPDLSVRKLNYRKDPEDIRDYSFKTSLKTAHLEEALKATPAGINHTPDMSPVKDQGRLGSCVAFAVAALKEWQEQKEHEAEVTAGKKDNRPDARAYNLSESWIYWMAKKIDSWPNEEGTSIRFAMKVLAKIGVPCEKAWRYSDSGDYGHPANWASLVARWSLIDSYWRIRDLNELKLALLDGPVAIGIGCYEEIFNVGSNGIVKDPANPNYCYGGHAICVVGYDNNKQRVKFKNSWGKDWGKSGYGFLSYRYINNYMWDAWTCKDLSVTKAMLEGHRELFGV